MAFYDKWGEKIATRSQEAVQKTKDLAGITRLNAEIAEMERNIQEQYRAIGCSYFADHEADAEDQYPAMGQIRRMKGEIEAKKQEILALRGVQICSKCGGEVRIGDAFCSKCGNPMPIPEPKEQTPAANICRNCGKELKEGARFCVFCGTPIDAPRETNPNTAEDIPEPPVVYGAGPAVEEPAVAEPAAEESAADESEPGIQMYLPETPEFHNEEMAPITLVLPENPELEKPETESSQFPERGVMDRVEEQAKDLPGQEEKRPFPEDPAMSAWVKKPDQPVTEQTPEAAAWAAAPGAKPEEKAEEAAAESAEVAEEAAAEPAGTPEEAAAEPAENSEEPAAEPAGNSEESAAPQGNAAEPANRVPAMCCPACGRRFELGQRFCISCGTRLQP